MLNVLYVILGIIGLFVVLQVSLRMKGWLKRGKPAPEVSGKLGQQIRRGEKILAYFYSPNCSACRTQEQMLPKVQEKFKNIQRVNAGREPQVARAFGVMGTPTTVVIEKGVIKAYFVGVASPAKLLKSLGVS